MKMISVIVPAYNASITIEKCVTSIMHSIGKIEDIEVICVNDGSKDDTGNILNRLSNEYPILKVLHKENGGASSARNAGLSIAEGKYIMFCDADDSYEEDTIRYVLYDLMHNDIDYLVFQRKTVFLDGSTMSWSKQSNVGILSIDWKEYLNHYITYKGHTVVVFNKVYKREIIDNYKIRFNETLTFGEDALFNVCFLQHVQHIYEDFRVSYLQYKSVGSITTSGRNDFYTQNVKYLYLIEKDYPILAAEIQPFINYHFISSIEVAVQRIISGRDVFDNPKKQIKEIISNEDMRYREASFDYKDSPYMKRKIELLLKNKIILYKIRYIVLPSVKKKIFNTFRAIPHNSRLTP